MNIIITMIIIISSSSISIIISSIGIIILIDTYTYIYICYYSYYSIRVHRPSPTTDASLQGRPTAMAGGVFLCSGCVAAPQLIGERSCAMVTHGTTANLRPIYIYIYIYIYMKLCVYQ